MSIRVKGTKHSGLWICHISTTARVVLSPMTSHAPKKKNNKLQPGVILAKWDSSGSDQRTSACHASISAWPAMVLRDCAGC